jgi:hypothetical protein
VPQEWEAVLFLATELEASKLQLSKPLVIQVERAAQALNPNQSREAMV